jgi:pimeloyl-ACP methyl ester carboxylesterase
MLRDLVAKEHWYTVELAKIRDVTFVDLPTGHWPMFTKPAELREALVAALAIGPAAC